MAEKKEKTMAPERAAQCDTLGKLIAHLEKFYDPDQKLSPGARAQIGTYLRRLHKKS